MIKSPSITSLRVSMLGANFIHLKWDDVGSNFFYLVEYTLVSGGVESWTQLGVQYTPEYFSSSLIPDTKYKFRVLVTHPGMERGDWVVSDVIETFSTNAYQITTMEKFIPSFEFIDKKLYKNKMDYIDFNNGRLQASLMNEYFIYDPGIANVTNVENFIAEDSEYHEILGSVSRICKDVKNIYLGVNKRIVYSFEKYQNYCKVTNDGGQNWYYYQAVTDRIGYPAGNTVMSQNSNTSFLLGYDYAFYGRNVNDVRFSSDQYYWSDDQLTFVKMDTDMTIPFPTMFFGTFALYPDDIRRKVEAQTVSSRWLYAAADGVCRRIMLSGGPVDSNGKIIWDPVSYQICDNPNVVVKKLDSLNDVCYALVSGEIEPGGDKRDPHQVKKSSYSGVYRFDEIYKKEDFVLGDLNYTDPDGSNYVNGIDVSREMVTFLPNGSHVGQVSTRWESRVFRGRTHGVLMEVNFVSPENHDSFQFIADIYSDITNKVIDPVKYGRFVADFAYPAVFDLYEENGQIVKPSVPDGGSWVRVFGNTEEERYNIEHLYSDMSTDGTKLFVSGATYRYSDTVVDTDLPLKYPDEVDSAVKYSSEFGYLSDKKVYLYQWETEDGSEFKLKPANYYNEAGFDYMAMTGERIWKNHENRIVLITPSTKYQYTIDTERNINKEVWDKGTVTFYLDNINFQNFSKYCNGILIHSLYNRENSLGGEIFGYYEFPYRVRDEASIIWRPEHVAMQAQLVNQERDVVVDTTQTEGLVDPDISPMLQVMGPEYYFNDSNFSKFIEYYFQFLSDGTDSMYGKLLNFIKLKYPREKDSFVYLWSEMRRRNIYLDQDKRDAVVKFFEANANNFYSSKGTIDSYKFLFKLLYNADVDVEIESQVGIDYDIMVKSSNISTDLVGRTIFTETGRANVTYIERQFVDGQLRWKITIHNLIGKFETGQEIKSESSSFTGEITRGVRGKELAYSDIDYINRNRSYYMMRIRSELNTARYKEDVIRFVHPVGFGFIGITLLTVFVNGGISMAHNETVVDINKSFRWDSGLPSLTPKYKTIQDPNGSFLDPSPLFDPVTGQLMEEELVQTPFDVSAWNNAINESTGSVFEARNYDTDESDWVIDGVVYTPSERRLDGSPLFSAFSSRFSDLKRLSERRLKDDIGLPRDVSNLVVPVSPSQVKVNK
ncbi:baseplate wedge initiator [Aeromonas phage Aswh_1]|nr:baseplate wedge initiator [Aeromonas phage Aswh_1]